MCKKQPRPLDKDALGSEGIKRKKIILSVIQSKIIIKSLLFPIYKLSYKREGNRMGIGAIGFTANDVSVMIAQYKADIQKKIEIGETEEAFAIGAAEFTDAAWNKLMEQLDTNLELVKEEQEIHAAEMDEQKEAQKLFREMTQKAKQDDEVQNHLVEKRREFDKVPYGYLAKDGVIVYNGVTFLCDETSNSITLGDVSDAKNVINIPLSGGGCLKVNRDSVSGLSKAIGMFSPEDVKRILQAIATDAKLQKMKEELEEDKESIGDSTEAAAEFEQETPDALTAVQLELLLHDKEEQENK